MMRYLVVVIAIAALLAVVLLPKLSPLPNPGPLLTDADVMQIAENYVETNVQGVKVVNSSITSRENGKWGITIVYEEGTEANCKVGKCYWEGPASMFCRPESNQSLGQCSNQ